MKPTRQIGLALLVLALSTPAQATDAISVQFRAEIQQFVDRLAAGSNGALRWVGSDPYEIRQDGNALLAVIRHARLSIKTPYQSGEVAFGPIAIRRSVEPDGKMIDFTIHLPSETLFYEPGPNGPAVLGTMALKDARAEAVIEARSELTRASALSVAGARIDLPAIGAWLRFGPLAMNSKTIAEPSGGWHGLSDFELKQTEFFLPQGALGGVIGRIAYQGKSAGPSLAAFDRLRLASGKWREKAAPDLPALLGMLSTLPQALGSFAVASVVEGVAVHDATHELGSVRKAGFAMKLAGLDGEASSLRLTLGEVGLSLPASLSGPVPVPDRVLIDLGFENLSNQALFKLLKVAAATPPAGRPSGEQEQQKLQQLLGAAAALEPLFRVNDIAVHTKDFAFDLSGQVSGSPLAPKGYSAAGDLAVRGLDAIASRLPPILREYPPLLRILAISENTADGTAQLRFHLASSLKQWITINGNDVSAWIAPPPQEAGQPRLLRLTYPPLSGPDVRRVQQALAAADIAVTESGVYDGATAAAVARFQRQNGLNVSGVLDAATREKLGVKPGHARVAPEILRQEPKAGHEAPEAGPQGPMAGHH
jgi:hypothetical protein